MAGDLDVGDGGNQPDDGFEASVAPLCAESVGEPAADGETDDAVYATAHAGGKSVAGGVARPAVGAAIALAQVPTCGMAKDTMGLEHPQESSLTLTASVARPRMRWARLLTLAANLGILGGAGWLILLAGPPWPWLKIRPA